MATWKTAINGKRITRLLIHFKGIINRIDWWIKYVWKKEKSLLWGRTPSYLSNWKKLHEIRKCAGRSGAGSQEPNQDIWNLRCLLAAEVRLSSSRWIEARVQWKGHLSIINMQIIVKGTRLDDITLGVNVDREGIWRLNPSESTRRISKGSYKMQPKGVGELRE